MPRLRLVCLSIDGVTEAHQVCLVTSGIGTTIRTDTRCFSTMPDTMLDRSFRNAYGSARAHSMLQSSCAPLPLPASPVLSLRSGIVGGVSLPEVLHYARRTQACHRPMNTRPHRLITKSSLEASSRHDFVTRFSARRKSRKKRKPKWAAETESAFRFIGSHWRFYRTFRSGEKAIF